MNLKIQEGDAHNITCPAYQCDKLAPVELIEGIVSRDMARRYLQFDIKVLHVFLKFKWIFFPFRSKMILWTGKSFTACTFKKYSLCFVEILIINLHEKWKRKFHKRRLKPFICMYMYVHGIFQITFITKMIDSVMFAGSKLRLYNVRFCCRCMDFKL